MKPFCLKLAVLVVSAFAIESSAQDEATKSQDEQQDALSSLQDYIGIWRGVGQLQRGSSEGAWRETTEWIWKFDNESVYLQFETADAKYFDHGILTAAGEDNKFELTTKKGETETKYSGNLDKSNRLILVREVDESDASADATEQQAVEPPGRITFRFAAGGKRLIALYEKQASANNFYRIAEVGYTREGSDFGKGSTYAECVVTGGKATIPVTFEGKTYYVCCSGCKAAFDEDPAGILEEYRKRLAEKDK